MVGQDVVARLRYCFLIVKQITDYIHLCPGINLALYGCVMPVVWVLRLAAFQLWLLYHTHVTKYYQSHCTVLSVWTMLSRQSS